jgi:hypothetical protein
MAGQRAAQVLSELSAGAEYGDPHVSRR